MSRPDSPTGLYWSIRGAVLCAEHAREIDDAQWAADMWAAVPPSSDGVNRSIYQCQQCSPYGLAIKPLSVDSQEECG